jgi:hypothetical protein
MYGIVNKAIEDLVISNFGLNKWELIKERSNVDTDFFISSEPYDDAVTFKLALAISDEMKISLSDVFIIFGEWWIIKTTKEKYPGLIDSGGNNLRDFLINLPNFHNRILMIYPKLTPPEFKVTNITKDGLHLHYFSKREGLQDFVRGLLNGLGKMFKTPISIELIQTREKGNTHEIFNINW